MVNKYLDSLKSQEYIQFLNLLDSKCKWSEIEKEIGSRQIVIFCNYDINKIRRNIQNKVKGNIRSRYIPRYKKLIAEIIKE